MKKTFLATAALAVLCGAAAAAEFPLPVKAPPAAAPYVPASWAGWYLEGYGAWGGEISGLTAALAGGSTIDIGGVPNGPGLGGAIGYTWQAANGWTFGLKADVAGFNLRGSGNVLNALQTSQTTNALGDFDVVIGHPLSVDGRFYGWLNGGLAWGNVNTSLTAVGLAQAASNSTRGGWNVGGGLGYLFDDHWFGKIELDYYKVGDVDLTAVVAGTPIVAGTAHTEILVQKGIIGYKF